MTMLISAFAINTLNAQDVTAPVISDIAAETAISTGDDLTLTVDEASVVYLVLHDVTGDSATIAAAKKAEATAAAPGSVSVSTTGLADSIYIAYAIDAAGNVSDASDLIRIGDLTQTAYATFNLSLNDTVKIEAEYFDKGGLYVAYNESNMNVQGGATGTVRPGELVDIGTGGSYSGDGVVGYTEDGEWLEYTLNVLQEGYYVLKIRYTNGEKTKIRFQMDGAYITEEIELTDVGGWNGYGDHTEAVFLSAGTQVFRVNLISPLYNLDYFEFSPVTEDIFAPNFVNFPAYPAVQTGDDLHVTVDEEAAIYLVYGGVQGVDSTTLADTALSSVTAADSGDVILSTIGLKDTVYVLYAVDTLGNISNASNIIRVGDLTQQKAYMTHNISLVDTTRIEGEHFDSGGFNVAYSEGDLVKDGEAVRPMDWVDLATKTAASGPNKLVVGYTKPGEWCEYTVNVQDAGYYELSFRYTNGDPNAKVHFMIDGASLTDTVTVPDVGGWTDFGTLVLKPLHLDAGAHVIRVTVVQDPYDIDYFDLSAYFVIDVADSVMQPMPFDITANMPAKAYLVPTGTLPTDDLLAAAKDTVTLVEDVAGQLNTDTLAGGDYLIYVVDTAGNVSNAIDVKVGADVIVPDITVSEDTVNRPAPFIITCENEDATAYMVTLGTMANADLKAASVGEVALTMGVQGQIETDTVSGGTYVIFGVDLKGNVSVADTVVLTTITDFTAPTITVATDSVGRPAPFVVTSNESADLYLVPSTTSGSDNLASLAYYTEYAVKDEPTDLKTDTVPNGDYLIFAKDAAGNVSDSLEVTVGSDIVAPVIAVAADSVQRPTAFSVTSDEKATAYLVPSGTAKTDDLASVKLYMVALTAGVAADLATDTVPAGDYIIYAVDTVGNVSDGIDVKVSVPSSIHEVSFTNVSVAPNPSSIGFRVDLSDINTEVRIEVYTITGKKIYDEITLGGAVHSIDASVFTNKGMYLMRVNSAIHKLIVK